MVVVVDVDDDDEVVDACVVVVVLDVVVVDVVVGTLVVVDPADPLHAASSQAVVAIAKHSPIRFIAPAWRNRVSYRRIVTAAGGSR